MAFIALHWAAHWENIFSKSSRIAIVDSDYCGILSAGEKRNGVHVFTLVGRILLAMPQ
jgi:hypothetical protein